MARVSLRALINKAGVTRVLANLTWFYGEDWSDMAGAIQDGTAGVNTEQLEIGGVLVIDSGGNWVGPAHGVEDLPDPLTLGTFNATAEYQAGGVGVIDANRDATIRSIVLDAGDATRAPLSFAAGVVLTVPLPGTVEYDGQYIHWTDGDESRWSLPSGVNTTTNYAFFQAIDMGGRDIENIGGAAFGVALSPAQSIDIAGGTSIKSPIRIRHGVAPTSPNNGDIWTTTAGVFARVNGSTVDLTAGGAVDSVFSRTGAVVAQTNDYTFAQIDKTTSSLADLTTRSAGDLSSGTLADARLSANVPLLASLNTFTRAQLIDGTADEVQQIVEGHSTQTSLLAVYRQSDGTTNVCTISNAGRLAIRDALTSFGTDPLRLDSAANYYQIEIQGSPRLYLDPNLLQPWSSAQNMDLGAVGGRFRDAYFGGHVKLGTTQSVGLVENASGIARISDGSTGRGSLVLGGTAQLQLVDDASRPAAGAGNRGMIWYQAGGAGVADTIAICAKDSGDAYAWVDLAVIA